MFFSQSFNVHCITVHMLLFFLNTIGKSLSKPPSGPGESQGSFTLGCSRLRSLKWSLEWLTCHEVSCCGAVIVVFQFQGIGLDLVVFAVSKLNQPFQSLSQFTDANTPLRSVNVVLMPWLEASGIFCQCLKIALRHTALHSATS